MNDRDPSDLPILRHVRLTDGARRWSVTLYDLGVTDDRGQAAIGYVIKQNRKPVARGLNAASAVYGSPLHADDSDATLMAAIELICYGATHDKDDRPIEAGWDAMGLDEAVALRWSDR